MKTVRSQFGRVSPGWDRVSGRLLSRWRLLNAHFLCRDQGALSSCCLTRHVDVTWPILQKFLILTVFKAVHCVLLQVLKVFFFFFIHPECFPQSRPYPVRCHHTEITTAWRISGFLSVLNRAPKYYISKTLRSILSFCPPLNKSASTNPSLNSWKNLRWPSYSYVQWALLVHLRVWKWLVSLAVALSNSQIYNYKSLWFDYIWVFVNK